MKTVRYKLLLPALLIIFIRNNAFPAASANLDQVRNGTAASPVSPGTWVNGNAGGSQAHYTEGMSVPYRCVMTGLTPGSQFTVVIGYDIRNSSRNAFDYLTDYNRLTPHKFGVHTTAEIIDPLIGTGLSGITGNKHLIPYPASSSDPTNQPYTSMSALAAAERMMTLYNGTIDTIYYVTQGNLTAGTSETQIAVKMTVTNATAVLAWGGHIASRNDWGYDNTGSPNSAGSISGSPFHMRLNSWTLGSIGSQDRSLSGSAVLAPPVSLPVSLLAFNASRTKEYTSITWSTASEKNSDYFELEKSTNGKDFYYITTVRAAGNSNQLLNYKYNDEEPLYSTTYYRLTETDIDGSHFVFGTVAVNSKINYATKELIYNMKGDLVMTNYMISESHQNLGLPDGIYISHYYSGSDVITMKFFVGKE